MKEGKRDCFMKVEIYYVFSSGNRFRLDMINTLVLRDNYVKEGTGCCKSDQFFRVKACYTILINELNQNINEAEMGHLIISYICALP